jgi:hypothetical protein
MACAVSLPIFALVVGIVLKAVFVVEYYWIWLLFSSFIPSQQYFFSASGVNLSIGRWAGEASSFCSEIAHVMLALNKACFHLLKAGINLLAIILAHPVVSLVSLTLYYILLRFVHHNSLVRSGEGA